MNNDSNANNASDMTTIVSPEDPGNSLNQDGNMLSNSAWILDGVGVVIVDGLGMLII